MDIVFLLGNGFDLNCGLKTSYKDMYAGYIESKSQSEVIAKFKKEISGDIDSWADFELEMAKYASKLNSGRELLECIRDFKRYMKSHLQSEEKKFAGWIKALKYHYSLNDEKNELQNTLNVFFENCGISNDIIRSIKVRGQLEGINIKYITFNYTNTLEVILNSCKENYTGEDIIHIHGDCKNDDIVVGIDNMEQVNVNYGIDKNVMRGFVKPYFNDKYDSNRVRRAKEIIKHADCICAFGLSLGETDLTWRNEILKNLESAEGKMLILFDYKYSTITNKSVEEKMELMDEARLEISDKWLIQSEEDLTERIFIPIGKNIFNFEKVISRDLKSFEQELAKRKSRPVG